MYFYSGDGSQLKGWIKKEVRFPGDIGIGKRGMAARRIQEWLCLSGNQLAIDSDFGGVTQDAVQAFQAGEGMAQSGVVDQPTHDALVRPMVTALSHTPNAGHSFGEAVMSVAEAHLALHPREVGGANRGPWVRMYMQSNEGTAWPWCAGFVTFCMHQAADARGEATPIKGSFSCDSLASQAKTAGLFVSERDAVPDELSNSAMFLVRRTSTDWTHVGLVSGAKDTSFGTVEGNTNDDGDREGYEVCARIRGYSKKDFIIL